MFDVDHEPIFRGREEQVCEILQRLRQCADAGCAFVVIIGASGSGKSSLARAGVAAHLLHFNLDDAVRQWRCAVFIPGMADGALFAGLARALASAGALPELCSQVDEARDKVKIRLRIGLHAGPVHQSYDAILQRKTFMGRHTNLAARLEPIAEEGQIFVSGEFAALATVSGDEHFQFDYVGQKTLPKDAGLIPVYRLTKKLVNRAA